MIPEEITTLFTTVAVSFQPIVGQPLDDNLTALRDVLYPLLVDIPYDEDGTHNLIGLMEQPSRSHHGHRLIQQLPMMLRLLSTPDRKPSTPSLSKTPTMQQSKQLQSSFVMQ
jgi:hypothetical protein